jgi:hypothetical protein
LTQNNHALSQLPYNGKKTVPAALRKDLWAPLARVHFPQGQSSAGLTTFRLLREYRKLHETQWDPSFAIDPETKKPLSRKLRGRKLCDQKANSIADLAAALKKVTVTETQAAEQEKEGAEKQEGLLGLEDKVTVQWADLYDAEFAKEWPSTVVHDQMAAGRNNREYRSWDAVNPGQQPEQSVEATA